MARVGVFICECGSNISDKIDIAQVIKEVSTMPEVVLAEPYRLMCSPDGRSYLEERIRKQSLTHVVIAACSPREHQQTFMKVCEKAGINPYLLQLVNIREQCAWVTPDPAEATEKATRMVKAAIARVRHQAPLQRREIAVSPDVLVVGGGVAGIEASLMLAGPTRKVWLVEKSADLGGSVNSFLRTYPDMGDYRAILRSRIARLRAHPGIEVLIESEVDQVLGFFGNFQVRVRSHQEGQTTKDLKVGALLLATGARLYDPAKIRGYGYGQVDNVLTAMEFESMCSGDGAKLSNGAAPRSVAIIHCVGREVKGYCSGICCMYALKFSTYLKESGPDIRTVHLYSDMCVPGKSSQAFLERSLRAGTELIRAAGIRVGKGEQEVRIDFVREDGSPDTLAVDMVILAPALEPQADAADLAEKVGIALDKEGFLARQHEILEPSTSSKEGVFVAGCAQGPKDIPGTVVQAQAAAGGILASLVPGKKMEIETKTSYIIESYCQGCKTCISVCRFGAISFDERRRVAVVNEVICRGCGNCSAACPSGAAVIKHSTYDQIYQEIVEAVK